MVSSSVKVFASILQAIEISEVTEKWLFKNFPTTPESPSISSGRANLSSTQGGFLCTVHYWSQILFSLLNYVRNWICSTYSIEVPKYYYHTWEIPYTKQFLRPMAKFKWCRSYQSAIRILYFVPIEFMQLQTHDSSPCDPPSRLLVPTCATEWRLEPTGRFAPIAPRLVFSPFLPFPLIVLIFLIFLIFLILSQFVI